MTRKAMVIMLCAVVPLSLFGLLMPRKPTPEEQVAITKYSQHINKMLDQFRGPAWEEKMDFALADPMVNPSPNRPLELTEIFQRTYNLRKTSAHYKTTITPLIAKMEKIKDQGDKQLQHARIEDLLHVQIRVNCNVLVSTLHPGPVKKNAILVPGSYSAYIDEDNPYGYGASYTILFGNAKSSRWDPAAGYYYYKFIHPSNSPNIENIEIRIFGADDRIKELLKKIDWKQVTQALTP